MDIACHLRTPCGKGYAFQRWSRVGYFPDATLEVELAPAGEAQLAGAYKHVQRQQDRQPGKCAAFIGVDPFLQFRQAR
ncbi:hypothetical protein D3C81_1427980 [compost metagenome]